MPKKRNPNPPRRGARLTTPRDVRRALAATYRGLELGRITPTEARARTQALRVLADVISTADLECRIRDLEERLKP